MLQTARQHEGLVREILTNSRNVLITCNTLLYDIVSKEMCGVAFEIPKKNQKKKNLLPEKPQRNNSTVRPEEKYMG